MQKLTPHPRPEPRVLYVTFAVAIALAGLFVLLQSRRNDPMLPLWMVAERNRAGSDAAMLFIGAGLMGTFYLLTLFLQQVQRFSPITTGLASLPFSAGIILGAGYTTAYLTAAAMLLLEAAVVLAAVSTKRTQQTAVAAA